MSAPLPYGLESWLPILRGGAAPAAVVRDEDGPVAARSAWQSIGAGERIALIAEGTPGREAPLATLEACLDGPRRIEHFVAFPGTGGGFVLLPTVNAAALRAGLPLLPAGRRRWRAARLGIGALAPLGVARLLGLTEVALATRGERASFGDALVADDEHCAVAAGVPDGRQKHVARIIDARGATRAFAKLAHKPASVAAILNERRALERVRALAPELAPELLDRGEVDGRPWFTMELLAGHRSPDVFHEGHAALLARLQVATLSRCALPEHPLLLGAVEALQRLDSARDPDWHGELTALAHALQGERADLPTSLAHGDFTSWNLAVDARGMRAFDWEAFIEDAPALYDVFHFHVQTGVLVHRRDASALFASLGSVLAQPARQLVRAAKMTAPDVLRAFGLYLLHVTTREEQLQRTAPAAFVQIGWQRRARRELARFVVGALHERRAPWSLPSEAQEDAA